MPVPLKTPQQWTCSRCHWRHNSVIQSDVLPPPPEKCPECGHQQWVLKPASLLGKLKDLLP